MPMLRLCDGTESSERSSRSTSPELGSWKPAIAIERTEHEQIVVFAAYLTK